MVDSGLKQSSPTPHHSSHSLHITMNRSGLYGISQLQYLHITRSTIDNGLSVAGCRSMTAADALVLARWIADSHWDLVRSVLMCRRLHQKHVRLSSQCRN